MMWVIGVILGGGCLYGLWQLIKRTSFGEGIADVFEGISDIVSDIGDSFSIDSSSGGSDGGSDGGYD